MPAVGLRWRNYCERRQNLHGLAIVVVEAGLTAPCHGSLGSSLPARPRRYTCSTGPSRHPRQVLYMCEEGTVSRSLLHRLNLSVLVPKAAYKPLPVDNVTGRRDGARPPTGRRASALRGTLSASSILNC